mgnify:CR=1 FL=1
MLGLDFAFEEARILSCVAFGILYQIVFVQNNPEAKVFNLFFNLDLLQLLSSYKILVVG